MILADVLNFTIDDGIESLREQLTGRIDRMRFEGGRDGFEACRGKEPHEIVELLAAATMRREEARQASAPDYWYHRYFEVQIEYVASVMSVALMQHGLPPIATVTARSVIRYAEIVGVKTS